MERMVTMSEKEFARRILLPGAHQLHPTAVVGDAHRRALMQHPLDLDASEREAEMDPEAELAIQPQVREVESQSNNANSKGKGQSKRSRKQQAQAAAAEAAAAATVSSQRPLADAYGNVPYKGPVPSQDFIRNLLIERKREAMLYCRLRKLLFRSQLDAHARDSQIVFDLKTRATNPIRLDVTNYRQHLDYMLMLPSGELFSFERERFDLARAAFLKYGFQCRIGNMGGVFVAYHNTELIFGFEYIPLTVMDEYVYGSTALADRAFEVTTHTAERVLTYLQGRFPDAAALRITTAANEQTSTLEFYVEKIDRVEQSALNVPEQQPDLAVAHAAFSAYREQRRPSLFNRDKEAAAPLQLSFASTTPDLGDPTRWLLLFDQLSTAEIERRLTALGLPTDGSRAQKLSRLESHLGSKIRAPSVMPLVHYELLAQRGLLHKLHVNFRNYKDGQLLIGHIDSRQDPRAIQTTLSIKDVTQNMSHSQLAREYHRTLSIVSSANQNNNATNRRAGAMTTPASSAAHGVPKASSGRAPAATMPLSRVVPVAEPDVDVDVQLDDDHLPDDIPSAVTPDVLEAAAVAADMTVGSSTVAAVKAVSGATTAIQTAIPQFALSALHAVAPASVASVGSDGVRTALSAFSGEDGDFSVATVAAAVNAHAHSLNSHVTPLADPADFTVAEEVAEAVLQELYTRASPKGAVGVPAAAAASFGAESLSAKVTSPAVSASPLPNFENSKSTSVSPPVTPSAAPRSTGPSAESLEAARATLAASMDSNADPAAAQHTVSRLMSLLQPPGEHAPPQERIVWAQRVHHLLSPLAKNLPSDLARELFPDHSASAKAATAGTSQQNHGSDPTASSPTAPPAWFPDEAYLAELTKAVKSGTSVIGQSGASAAHPAAAFTTDASASESGPWTGLVSSLEQSLASRPAPTFSLQREFTGHAIKQALAAAADPTVTIPRPATHKYHPPLIDISAVLARVSPHLAARVSSATFASDLRVRQQNSSSSQ
jgi:hypothetical protein